MYNLNGKVALVTGAGGKGGLGRAIAVRLADEGADVVVNDINSGSSDSTGWGGLSSVVQEIQALGRRGLGIVADVTDAGQVHSMVDQALQQLGRIDILVNSAAAPAGRDRVPVVELAEDAWDLVQRVNVRGLFLCCKAVARAMINQRQGGRIINMSSISGLRGRARYAAYCASKFAVRGFTQALALELAPHHINVNAIGPSHTVTDLNTALIADPVRSSEFAPAFRQSVGAKRNIRRASASFWPPVPQTTSSGRSSPLTGDGVLIVLRKEARKLTGQCLPNANT